MALNNWKEVKLGDLIESISIKHRFDKDKLIFLNTSDVLEGKILHEEYSDVDKMPGQAKKSISKGDILFSEIRPKNKRFAFVEIEADDYVVSTKLMVLRQKSNNADMKFLYHFLTSEKTLNYLQMIAEGRSGTFPQITFSELKNITIKLPSIIEQKNISHFLENIESKIKTNNQINQKLEEMSQAIFKKWFVDFDFPNKNGNPYKTCGGKMIESVLGMIPEGWSIKTIDEITSLIIDHRGKTPKKLGGEWEESGFPAISAKNIKNNRIVKKDDIKFINHDLYSKWMKDPLNEGDILMTSEAPLGEYLYLGELENFCLSQRLFGIRANPNIISPSVLYLSLNSTRIIENIKNRATGSTVTGIRQAELRKVPIIIPPLDLQNKITELLDGCLKKVYLNEKENDKLQEIRDTLLPKLMSGEIQLPLEMDDVVLNGG
ncbi:restriction endonuclease subunit S [Niallia sp. MER TA 168]|uniref:restriction endonuclease subunit S n=1 Tax=Niallia sp. MER TA 168 TaxID=2939568 RepID=UPI00203C9ACC|nr:restriction endonuclease subunit S [Niallia sp. MER TA 168]MCM3360366.1 restriction endonuclease subunit S [Niallia sp. MER TA 168]